MAPSSLGFCICQFARTSEVLLKTDIRVMKFIRANNSRVETVKYLISKITAS